jgi:hypothetical protein
MYCPLSSFFRRRETQLTKITLDSSRGFSEEELEQSNDLEAP